MKLTGNLNLKKPEGTDVVNIDDLNQNMDILDVEVAKLATPSQDGRMSATDKAKLDSIQSGAEVNQNAFSNVKVGNTTITADSKTDTLELVAGSNITLTPDEVNDKVTISATVPVTSVNGRTGAVTLNASDVGASPKGHTHTFAEITGKPNTLAGYGITDAVKSFSLPISGPSTSYVKIAELNTNIGAGDNGLILYVNGVADYGTNMPGVDILQVSTRVSVNLKVYRLIPSGSDDITYGYVNNTTTGKTEIWLKRDDFNYAVNIIVANATNATYGNLLTQNTEPAGIVYVTKELLVELNDSVTSTSTTQAATANAVKQANDNANNRVSKSGDTMTGPLTVPSLIAQITIPSDSPPSAWPTGFVAGTVYNNGYPVPYGTIFSYKWTFGNPVVQLLQAWPENDGGEAYLYIRSARDTGADVFGPWRKVWSENNDGTGSGLDADMVDGKHLSDIQADTKSYTDQQLARHSAETESKFTNINLNIIDMAVELETLKGATLNGVTANIFIETFTNLNDINLMRGGYDSVNKRLVV